MVVVKFLKSSALVLVFVEYIILMLALLVLEVASNYSFIFNAGLLGQSVVKDIRVKLFDHRVLNSKTLELV